jgi:DNA repair exonuclease SbcCD nuclease subunit
LDELAAKGYDYWALGHVHEHAILREKPLIVYSGCSQGRHIKETGQKGCVFVEVDNGILRTEFVPLDVFRWIKVTVDLGGATSIEEAMNIFGEALEEEMAKQDGRPCCVRVVLKGRCPIHGRLSTDPDTVLANIRTVATDVSRGRAWIEKVELNTTPDFDLKELLQSDTPQGELLRYLDELSSSSELFEDLGLDLNQLKSKLFGSNVVVPEASTEHVLGGARDILLTMLAEVESKESR